jgi:hypothetical protein
VVDTGYLGIKAYHSNSELPKKKSKLRPLSQQDKQAYRELASLRVLNEHVIGRIKVSVRPTHIESSASGVQTWRFQRSVDSCQVKYSS